MLVIPVSFNLIEYVLPIVLVLICVVVLFTIKKSFFKKKDIIKKKFTIKKTFFEKNDIIKKKSTLSIPGYEIFYTDKKTGDKKDGVYYSMLLFSEALNISGKPDYIFKKKSGRELIPIELKSGSIGSLSTPRKGDLMQLCAYFAIIESFFGIKPNSGRLIYSDYMFIIKNTHSLRNELISVIDDMHLMLNTGQFAANPSFTLCKHCICRGTVCEHCNKAKS